MIDLRRITLDMTERLYSPSMPITPEMYNKELQFQINLYREYRRYMLPSVAYHTLCDDVMDMHCYFHTCNPRILVKDLMFIARSVAYICDEYDKELILWRVKNHETLFSSYGLKLNPMTSKQSTTLLVKTIRTLESCTIRIPMSSLTGTL